MHMDIRDPSKLKFLVEAEAEQNETLGRTRFFPVPCLTMLSSIFSTLVR